MAVPTKVSANKKDYGAVKEFVPGVTPVPVSGAVRGPREIQYGIQAVLDEWWTEGPWTDRFEKAVAEYIGVRYGMFCNSGSSANMLAISALTSHLLKDRRLKPGDRVITTAAGFPTTINPILWNRLTPYFIDVELGTYVPSIDMIEHAIEVSGAKAVMIAHTLGNPWPVHEFVDKKTRLSYRDLWIIEDNCDALGSEINGARTGSLGDLATQSFYPAHHITTGEGGMVLCKEPILKRAVESFRDWGRDCWCAPGSDNTCGKRFQWNFETLPDSYDHKYVYSHLGFNMKGTDLQAAIGCAQIDRVEEFWHHRDWVFLLLHSTLRSLINMEDWFIFPRTAPDSLPSWFGFPLTIKDGAPFDLPQVEKFLAERKIGSRRLFAGNYLKQPVFWNTRELWQDEDTYDFETLPLPNTDVIAERTFWIGAWHGITGPMFNYVLECFSDFVQSF